MDIFLKDDELEEVSPFSPSTDKGKVIRPGKNEIGESNAGRSKDEEDKRSDTVKELIANDVIELGAREAALIHGVSKSQANEYSNGNSIKDPEVKTRVMAAKNNIQDLAVMKLMETLDLLDPHSIDKERDKVAVINGLSQVIQRIEESGQNKEGNKALHLHLYNPGTGKETDYGEPITVRGT